jgi:hypothetical protein
MSAPQTKERPASMLRAMFAGFGSLMSVMDKIRSKPAAEAPADADALAAPAEAPAAPVTEATAEPVSAPVPAGAAADTKAEPVTAAVPAVAEPATASEPATTSEPATEPATATETVAAAEPDATAALPLPNYDELTVASLRARLRNLSNDDITVLSAYEQAHQNRPEVVKMFTNRLIKMTTGLPKLES